MKKSEIAMIILVAGISMMIAFSIANTIPQLKPSEEGVEVRKADSISAEIPNKPSKEVFNEDAINPTVQTVIGGNASQEGE